MNHGERLAQLDSSLVRAMGKFVRTIAASHKAQEEAQKAGEELQKAQLELNTYLKIMLDVRRVSQ